MAEQKTATQQLEEFRAMLADMQAKLPALEAQAAKENAAQKPVDLEKPPTVAAEPAHTQSASNDPIDEDAEHKNFIKHLAQLPLEQRNAEISKAANPAVMGKQAAEAVANNLNLELNELNKIQPFDKVVGGFIQNNVNSTFKLSSDGYVGQSGTVQQNLPILPEGTGALFGNATINQDKNLNVTSGSLGLNYATPVKQWGDLDFVGIANVDVNIPAEGDFGGKNVSGLVGTVIKPHEGTDRANYTLAALLNGQGDVGALGRVSKQLYKDGDVEATGYVQGVYDITNNKLNPGGGLRVDLDLGKGNSIYSNTSLSANDVLNKPELTGSEQVGFAWGGPERTSKAVKDLVNAVQPTSLARNDSPTSDVTATNNIQTAHQADSKEVSHNTSKSEQINTSNQPTPERDPMREASEKYFSLDGKKQDQFVSQMANNFAKQHPNANVEGVKDYLVETFNGYQQQSEQVVQR